MPGSREEGFLRNTSILHFLSQNYLPLCGGGGHEIYNFLSPYPRNATYKFWLRLAYYILRKKMLMHDGRRPIVIGHLSDSGDLKSEKQ